MNDTTPKQTFLIKQGLSDDRIDADAEGLERLENAADWLHKQALGLDDPALIYSPFLGLRYGKG